MVLQRWLLFALMLPAVGMLGVVNALGCQCGERQTVLVEFNETPNIVTVKVTAVRESNNGYAVNGLKSVTAIVEKTYRGKLKTGTELQLAQGGGADCIWEFEPASIGEEFLFYLTAPNPEDGLWYATFCNRSSTLAHASDDLLYLDNLPKLRGRTRLSGTVNFDEDEVLSAIGFRIRIRGEHKTYQVRTDRHGVYELYDLPAGKYLIEPEIPPGWSVYWYQKYDDPYQLPKPKEVPPPPENQVVVEAGAHTEFGFALNAQNAIEGIVVGPNGEPLEKAEVSAIRVGERKSSYLFPETTKADGRFRITDLGTGEYYLVVNLEGRVDPDHRYPTTYYPDASGQSQATPIHIGVGETIGNIRIAIPRLEEFVTISGILTYADGQPVKDGVVEFQPQGKPRLFGEFRFECVTDDQGRFSIDVVKGSRGVLKGIIQGGEEDYSDCAEIRGKITKIDDGSVELRTGAMPIEVDKDLGDLVLTFTVRACGKVKD